LFGSFGDTAGHQQASKRLTAYDKGHLTAIFDCSTPMQVASIGQKYRALFFILIRIANDESSMPILSALSGAGYYYGTASYLFRLLCQRLQPAVPSPTNPSATYKPAAGIGQGNWAELTSRAK
jgi:hypothetical protein